MKTMRLIAWVLSAAPLAMAAEGTRPHPGRVDFTRPVGPRASRDTQPVDDQEWEQIKDWMRQNSPNRLNFIEYRMDGNEQQKQRARQLVAMKYRQLKSIPFKKLRDAMEAVAKAQDQVFGAQLQVRDARRDRDEGSEKAAQEKLHQAVEALIDSQIAERQVRIDRLKGEIESLKKHKADVANNWYKRFLNRLDGAPAGRQPAGHPTENASPDDADAPSGR